MAIILAFDWDNLYITPDEDPAFAGDKEAHSPDDKECGEHFIPKWKDCHDGGAHRPEPGENPYWTDDNSAEERKDRGVPWDTNKPKSQEERDKETDWQDPEEDVPEIPEEELPEEEIPEEEPVPEEELVDVERDEYDTGPTFEEEESVLNIPDAEWKGIENRFVNSMQMTQAMLAMMRGAAPASEQADIDQQATTLSYAFEAMNEGLENRLDILEVAETFQNAVDSQLGWLDANSDKVPRPEEWRNFMADGQFALDSLRDAMKSDDPRDIMVWNKIQNAPETVELQDIMQIAPLKGMHDDNLDERAMQEIDNMTNALERWKESPLNGGAELASKFFGPRSPWELNGKLAMAILDRSARAGDSHANKALWKDFGLSEEWHPTSFLHDHEKAADRAKREMETMADWGPMRAAENEMMQAGMELAEAEFAWDEVREKYKEMLAPSQAKYEAGEITLKTLDVHGRKAEKALNYAAIRNAVEPAEKKVTDAGYRRFEESVKVRGQIIESLVQSNASTKADVEIQGDVLSGADNARWKDINPSKYQKNGKWISKEAKMLHDARDAHRSAPSRYPNRGVIKEKLSNLFDMAHGNLFGDPKLREIDWQSEVMYRAAAGERENSIILGVLPNSFSKGEKAPMDKASTAIHEFAHHLEFRNQDVAARMQGFFEKRVKGDAKLHSGTEGVIDKSYPEEVGKALSNYGLHEMFRLDRFYDLYVGRWYGPDLGGNESSELVSMGLEAFFDEEKWKGISTEDPEHLALIVAMLKGY